MHYARQEQTDRHMVSPVWSGQMNHTPTHHHLIPRDINHGLYKGSPDSSPIVPVGVYNRDPNSNFHSHIIPIGPHASPMSEPLGLYHHPNHSDVTMDHSLNHPHVMHSELMARSQSPNHVSQSPTASLSMQPCIPMSVTQYFPPYDSSPPLLPAVSPQPPFPPHHRSPSPQVNSYREPSTNINSYRSLSPTKSREQTPNRKQKKIAEMAALEQTVFSFYALNAVDECR